MKSRGALRGMFAGVLALSLALVPTLSATADTTDGNWWYDYYNVGQAHAEGWTGKGVKITVIDKQINPDLPVFTGANLKVDPTAYCGGSVSTTSATTDSVHGTSVTALLIGNGTGAGSVRGIAPEASVTFEGYGTDSCGGSAGDLSGFGRALRAAIDSGSQIITTSVGFNVLTDSDVAVLGEALSKGIIVLAAVKNKDAETTDLPAKANGVVSVNAIDRDKKIQSYDGVTTIDPEVTVVAAGVAIATVGDYQSASWDDTYRTVGSSSATPLVAGMLAATKQKYPDATANQLIQSLIHNTTPDEHELIRDTETGYGYGPASLSHLLAVDPAKYPDTNPLVDKSYGEPTAAQIAGKAAASSSPQPSGSAGSGGSDGGPAAAAPVGLFVGIGIAVLVVIAIVVILIVVLSRRKVPRGNGGNA